MTDESIPAPEPADGDPQTAGPVDPSVSTAVPPRCPTRTRVYKDGELVDEGFPAEQISDHLATEGTVVWLDLYDPDVNDLGIVVQEFGLHPLAVEDAVQDHQRPKLDRYPTHLFANMYAVALDPDTFTLASSEISAFITSRALVTVRKDDFDVDRLQARWDGSRELTRGGVGFLVHGLLDAIVDGHYEAIQQVEDDLDTIEEQLFEPTRPAETDLRRRGFQLSRSVMQLRRVAAPMREVVERIQREGQDLNLAGGFLKPYYEDVHDHVLHAAEGVENARDRIAGILDSLQNAQAQQLNEITKKLAAWAAIIAVPTAITGYYGQNVPYPGYGHHAGWVISTVVIVGLSVSLWFLLRRRGWL